MEQKNNTKEEAEFRNINIKKKICDTIENGDVASLARLGFENFIRLINERPIMFKTFLEHTGEILDQLIVDVSLKEKSQYVGGKLIIQLKADDTMALLAKMYFKDNQEKWTEIKREGSVSCSRFIDWNGKTVELCDLREHGVIEIPIEAPEKFCI